MNFLYSLGPQLKESRNNEHSKTGEQENLVSKKESRRQSSTKDIGSSDEDKKEDGDGETGDEIDGEAGDRDNEEDGEKSESEVLIDGIFAVDNINDSALTDNDGDGNDDTTANEQSVLVNSSSQHQTSNDSGSIVGNHISSGPSTPLAKVHDIGLENPKYVFNNTVLRKGNGLDTKCTFCGEEDHIVDHCTAEQVTRNIKPLPDMPDWFEGVLTDVCCCCRGTVLYN